VWDTNQSGYTALFSAAKAAKADCVYLAGTVGTNGLQLIRDKVAVLGNNNDVKLLVPDGFSGRPAVDALPEAQGMYLTFAGLAAEQLYDMGGNTASFINAYKARYGHGIDDNYTLYGVQALQVILKAIAESDGTRTGVHDAVFGRDGLAIPANTAILGKAIHIDPATGDVTAHDVTVLQLRGGKEIIASSAGAST
jgi:branched-chain amino acid transport system substrate-binding protein